MVWFARFLPLATRYEWRVDIQFVFKKLACALSTLN